MEHYGAVDYDLMTLTRWTVDDLGGALPWGRLARFLRNLPADSATCREITGDTAPWLDGRKVAPLLADLIDAVNLLRYEFALSNTPKDKTKPNQLPPYPRPNAEGEEEREAFDYDALRAKLYG